MLAATALVAQLLVVCAPGYPGTTAEAQPAMDALAAALGPGVSAVYFEKEQPGVERIEKEAAVALVPLPFYLKYKKALGLHARLMAVQQGGEALESWQLFAGKGAASLEGYTVQSAAGYAPAFVRAAAPAAADAKIVQSSSVLRALRKAAAGEKVAALLDGAQSAAAQKLGADLAVLASSPKWPAAVLATVGDKVDESRWAALDKAFRDLVSSASGAEALKTVRMEKFVPLDEAALKSAEAAYERAKK